jgi:transposase
MIAVPDTLPDDPDALKQLLSQVLLARQSDLNKISQLQEQVALLRHKLFSPKSERSPEDARLAAVGHVQRGRRAGRRGCLH